MRGQITATSTFITKCASVQGCLPGVTLSLETCSFITTKFPENVDDHVILLKVVVMNSLLGTGIRDVVKVAGHINQIPDLDGSLKCGCPSVIDKIRQGHGIPRPKSEGDRDLYSFATKYAHFHNQSAYPIYDNNVVNALKKIKARCGFTDRELSYESLREYKVLKDVIDALRDFAKLEGWDYRRMDAPLWAYGKYLKGEVGGDAYKLIECAEKGFISAVVT
jgi:hypothetical protein